jgi:hypothetical protein
VRDGRGRLVGWQREGSEGKNVDEKKGFGSFSQETLCGVEEKDQTADDVGGWRGSIQEDTRDDGSRE